MCMGGSSPSYTPSAAATQEQVAAPTYADAKVSKTSANTRNKMSALAGRDIKTSTRGLSDDAETNKKGLLGE